MLDDCIQQYGTTQEYSGNHSLGLCAEKAVARVAAGHLDFFVTRLDERGYPCGRQRCIASLSKGGLFFFHPGYCNASGLLARTVEPTVLQILPLEQIPDGLVLATGAILDEWALSLGAFIQPRITVRSSLHLSPEDRQVELDSQRPLLLTVGSHTPLWLVQPQAQLNLGIPQAFTLSGIDGFPMPLTHHCTVRIESPIAQTARFLSGEAVVREYGLEGCLDAFARYLSATTAKRLDKQDEEDTEHDRYQADFDRLKWRRSIGYLARMVDATAGGAIASVGDVDPLQVVMEMVVRELGNDFVPPEPLEYQSDEQPLARIAKANNLRPHEVKLRDDWFAQESLPMLGYFGEELTPVALLPSRNKRVKAHFPDKRDAVLVSRANAREFSANATIFFKPLPRFGLSVGQLLKIALAACLQERRTIILSGFLAAIIGLLVPMITSEVMNKVVPSNDLGYLFQIAIGLVAAALASAIFELFKAVSLMRVNFKGEAAVQPGVWDRLLKLPLKFFRAFSAGDLANRANSIIDVTNQVKGTVVSTALGGIFAVVNFAVMFHFDAKLAFCGLGIAAVAYLVLGLLTWKQYRAAHELFDIQGRISGMVLQFTNGISKLKAAGAEWRAYEQWARMFTQQKELDYRSKTFSAWQEVFSRFYDPASKMLIIALLLYQWEGLLDGGQYAAFSAALGAFISAILSMATVMPFLASVALLLKRLDPILTALPEVTTARTDPGILTGTLELNHAFFRYAKDGPLVLNDVSLHAAPGEFIAIVGGSGSGKSTVFRLLLGFEEPEAGEVFYDGMGLGQLDVDLVRRQIGVVLQDGNMMPGDIYTNIAGGTDITIDEAWAALRLAGLEEDVRDMAMGIFTVISEGARTFSGGQKQRLMIARALARRPKLLLFDEATSALDNRTQRIVAASVEALNITRVIIAHRLSTIMHAHRIYVLEHGRITQVGTYKDLMAREGWFQTQARRQTV